MSPRMSLASMLGVLLVPAILTAADASAISFRKVVLTDTYYCDGVNVGDFNRDGRPDIVAGPFWYEGPEFTSAHAFYEPVAFEPAKSPTNSMFSFVWDFSGDGWDDILVLGRVHLHAAYWYENPGLAAGDWKKHYVFDRVQGENPPFGDLTGDGLPEIVCHHKGRWGYVAPDWARPREPWTFHPITAPGNYDKFYHGEGIGDIDGDGLADLVLNDGWWENPGERATTWPRHPTRFSKGRGGAQMLVQDVDGDGLRDVVTALDAHGWGLAWFEQTRDPASGRIAFIEHKIMGDRSEIERFGVAFTQPHALDVADIDGDGLDDIVVGKRLWAHGPQGDIEPNAAPVVYWFRLTREPDGEVRYTPQRIDADSGVGLQIGARDVTGDGKTDVVTCSKLGVFLFVQK